MRVKSGPAPRSPAPGSSDCPRLRSPERWRHARIACIRAVGFAPVWSAAVCLLNSVQGVVHEVLRPVAVAVVHDLKNIAVVPLPRRRERAWASRKREARMEVITQAHDGSRTHVGRQKHGLKPWAIAMF